MLAALLLASTAACAAKDSTTNNYYQTPNTDTTPPVADPCATYVTTAQPTLAFADAQPVGTTGTPYTITVSGTTAAVPYVQKQAITAGGLQFRDLNANGQLDRYEDWRLSPICRARDLVSKMTVAQKIGLMSEGGTIGSPNSTGALSQSVVNSLAIDLRRYALIRFNSATPAQYATYMNNLQKLCEGMPLGIPLVVTGDPVHRLEQSTDAATGNQSLSQSGSFAVSVWPHMTGLGAINDTAVTFQYGDTVRKEFKALGFRWQLGPLADLATEPRWSRVYETFGENAPAVAKHVKACILGFQGNGDLRTGIAATMKHFPGAGPDQQGMDSHSAPGKFNVYPGNNFAYHTGPFQAAIEAGAAAVMPCYSIIKVPDRNPTMVGSAHSKALITEYLKTTLGFDGMVTGDWGAAGGSAWGLELLTNAEKAASFVKAGSHQLGNDASANIQAAFDQGLLALADIDGAAAKILEVSFKLGVFENPYSDPAVATATVRSQETMLAGFNAQKKAFVLLKNGGTLSGNTCATTGANVNAACLPISQTRYGDKAGGTTGAPDVGEFASDSNGNGTIEVSYDGLTDSLAGTDPYSTWLLDYAYSTAGSGTAGSAGFALPIVQASAATADIAVLRITARKGTYFGLDAGVPLSFDGPFPGTQTDGGLAAAVKDAHKVIDLFRIRDGYTDSNGNAVAPVNPTLKIVLVIHAIRPPIVKPFVNGLKTLDETLGVAGSYPLVSNEANVNQTLVTAATATPTAHVGADTILFEYGAYDRAVLDFIFKKNSITGWTYGAARLPIEVPSTDAAVAAQLEDVASDSVNPTFSLGAGMNLPSN
jgi:beta-glucosidase